MILKCVIIDDEPLAIDVIAGYIEQTPFLSLSQKFTHPVKAFEYLSENRIDLLFIDIQMPDLSGIELVRNLEYKPVIIFTTAYEKYALEGFKVDAIDYLLKPVSYADFLKSANKVRSWFNALQQKPAEIRSNKDFLFIKSEYKIVRINFDDIRYIEAMSEYIRIHLVNSRPVMTQLSMKSIEEQLPEARFMRVHRSFIINLSKISVIERNRVIFDGNVYIPVSDQYKSKFQNYLDKNFLS